MKGIKQHDPAFFKDLTKNDLKNSKWIVGH